MNNDAIVLIFLPVLIGIVFTIVGIVMLRKVKEKERKCTYKINGKVIEVNKRIIRNSDSACYNYGWFPVFEYNIGEKKYRKESIYWTSSPKYEIGQTVEIYCNPEDYNEYYIRGENIGKNLGLIFSIVGITCIMVFFIILPIVF